MSARRSIWFNDTQINKLASIVANALQYGDDETGNLRGIHDEIAVAHQRSATSRVPVAALNLALGRSASSVPLRLSLEEISLLASLPNIDSEIKQELVRSL